MHVYKILPGFFKQLKVTGHTVLEKNLKSSLLGISSL